MTTYQWFVFFLFVQVIHFLGTWKLYEAAGRKRWEAAIPIYNSIVLMKIIGRPTWWTILLFIPIINLIMFPVIWVETLKSFGKRSFRLHRPWFRVATQRPGRASLCGRCKW